MTSEYKPKRSRNVLWRPTCGNYNTFKTVKLALRYISGSSNSLTFVTELCKIGMIAEFLNPDYKDDLRSRKLLAPVQTNNPITLPAVIIGSGKKDFIRDSIFQDAYPA